jgi:hypothetical protein
MAQCNALVIFSVIYRDLKKIILYLTHFLSSNKTNAMKPQTLFYFLLTILITAAGCKKHKNNDPVDKLPPATQTGANTLGFLLNGEPWTPQGFNGTANLSIDYDPGFNNGILGIVAYRTISATDKTQFIIGVSDSMNFLSIPTSLNISKHSLAAVSYSTKDYCDINHNDTTVYSSGTITLTKLDKTSRIISGIFQATLYKQSCGDTIKITEGRFDMTY